MLLHCIFNHTFKYFINYKYHNTERLRAPHLFLGIQSVEPPQVPQATERLPSTLMGILPGEIRAEPVEAKVLSMELSNTK